jgi:hypothetical protein
MYKDAYRRRTHQRVSMALAGSATRPHIRGRDSRPADRGTGGMGYRAVPLVEARP